MPLPDDLERLNVLHERGALTDEEFAIAKKRLLEGAPEGAGWSADPQREPASTLSRLYRSPTNRWFGGVCSGLGELTGIPAWSWRILFVLTAFLHGLGLLMHKGGFVDVSTKPGLGVDVDRSILDKYRVK